MYEASSDYDKGRPDPFAEISDDVDEDDEEVAGGSTSTTTGSPASSDGTFYNSSKVK